MLTVLTLKVKTLLHTANTICSSLNIDEEDKIMKQLLTIVIDKTIKNFLNTEFQIEKSKNKGEKLQLYTYIINSCIIHPLLKIKMALLLKSHFIMERMRHVFRAERYYAVKLLREQLFQYNNKIHAILLFICD